MTFSFLILSFLVCASNCKYVKGLTTQHLALFLSCLVLHVSLLPFLSFPALLFRLPRINNLDPGESHIRPPFLCSRKANHLPRQVQSRDNCYEAEPTISSTQTIGYLVIPTLPSFLSTLSIPLGFQCRVNERKLSVIVDSTFCSKLLCDLILFFCSSQRSTSPQS